MVKARTQEQADERVCEAILGRMIVEGARSLSDAEIERTLSPCVCGPRLVEAAKRLRDRGRLDPQELATAVALRDEEIEHEKTVDCWALHH